MSKIWGFWYFFRKKFTVPDASRGQGGPYFKVGGLIFGYLLGWPGGVLFWAGVEDIPPTFVSMFDFLNLGYKVKKQLFGKGNVPHCVRKSLRGICGVRIIPRWWGAET